MTQAIASTTRHRISQWLKRKRWLLGYIVCFNVFIFLSGWVYLKMLTHPEYLSLFYKLEPVFGVFTILRIGLEVLIYFNWRTFVALLRRWFGLSVKFTWALLQYRIAFKFLIYIELAMLMVRTIGKGGL